MNHAANVHRTGLAVVVAVAIVHCPLSIFRAEEPKVLDCNGGQGVGRSRVPDDKSSLASCLSVVTKEKLKNKSHGQQHKQQTADAELELKLMMLQLRKLTECVSARYVGCFDRGQRIWSP